MSQHEQSILAIKVLLQDFAKTNLKINAAECKKIKISKIEQNFKNKCEVVLVTFAKHVDITAVNSKYTNLNQQSNNRIFQYVPKQLKKWFKAFKTAVYQI